MAPSFFPSRAPSVSSSSTTRKHRGFQPHEVIKSKSAFNHQDTSPTSDEDKESMTYTVKTPTDLAAIQGSQVRTPPKKQVTDKARKPVTNVSSKENDLQSGPVSNPHNGKVSSSEFSSVEIVVNDGKEQTFWSRALPPAESPASQDVTPKATWDNGTSPLDKPSWLRTPLPGSADVYDGPTNVDFRNLPPYHSPFKGPATTPSAKRNQHTETTSSFNRQMVNLKRQVHSIDNTQPQRASDPAQNNGVKAAEESHVNGSQAKSSVKVPPNSEFPPHTKAQISPLTFSTKKGDQEIEDQTVMIAPHLRRSMEKSTASTQSEVIDATAEITIAAAKPLTLPPHLQNKPHSNATAQPCEAGTDIKASRQNTNIDEELAAASQCIINTENDAEIAVPSTNNNEEHVIPQWHGDNSKETTLGQSSGKMTSEGQDHPNALPPHLRKSKPKSPKAGTDLQSEPLVVMQPALKHHNDQKSAVASPSGTPNSDSKSRRSHKPSPPAGGLTVATDNDLITKKGKEPFKVSALGNDASELCGWDGKLAPPPLGEDWAERPQVSHKDERRLLAIEKWTENQAADMQSRSSGHEEPLVSPVDATHPETIPNPDEFNQAKRHLSAADAMADYDKHPTAGKSSKEPLSREGRHNMRRLQKDLFNNHAALPPNEHAPEANIYLRPAEMKDMRQVTLIHNYYILHSSFAQEMAEHEEIYWRERFQECHEDGNPFLVAIHKGEKAAKGVRDVHRKKSENVVGFAFAADYGLKSTIYRFTVELELWVHQDHLHQGIGMSMLDRILAAVDPGYNVLECAPLLGKYDSTRWSGGGHRMVKSILVNLLYQQTGEKDVEWKKNWLSNKNFEYQDTLSQIGFKFDEPWVLVSN